MTRQVVESSNVTSVGYDLAKQILEVQFRADRHGDAKVYAYTGVDAETAARVIEARSVGSAIASEIKGRFPSQVVAHVGPDAVETRLDGEAVHG